MQEKRNNKIEKAKKEIGKNGKVQKNKCNYVLKVLQKVFGKKNWKKKLGKTFGKHFGNNFGKSFPKPS